MKGEGVWWVYDACKHFERGDGVTYKTFITATELERACVLLCVVIPALAYVSTSSKFLIIYNLSALPCSVLRNLQKPWRIRRRRFRTSLSVSTTHNSSHTSSAYPCWDLLIASCVLKSFQIISLASRRIKG